MPSRLVLEGTLACDVVYKGLDYNAHILACSNTAALV